MSTEREEYVNWRGKNADPRKHGGVRAASFVCGKIFQVQLRGNHTLFNCGLS